MFKWLKDKAGMIINHVAGEVVASGTLKGFVKDQTGALQASWFHTLSNADESIFEVVKGQLYRDFIAQGATPVQAAAVMREFEEYLASLEDWRAILFRLTVVTETSDEKRKEILGRMFHDISEDARNRIIQNIVGDEPITHRVCEHVKAHYRDWADWFIDKIVAAVQALANFVVHTVPDATVRAARATDQFMDTHVAPPLERTLTDPVGGWAARLDRRGQNIKDNGGV